MAVAQRLALEIKQEVASLMGNAGGIEVDATDAAGLGQLLRRASPALGTKYSDALIVAVHTDCDPTRLNDLHRGHRIHAADNLDGLLLGEAAAALVLTSPAQLRATGRSSYLDLDTPEVLMDPARWDNDESSFKAGALTLAAKKCTDRHFQAGGRVGWVSTDVSFEMFRVHELQSVMARLQRRLGMPQVLDSPCQRIGNLGAATGVWQLAYAAEAIRRGFAPSREMLCLLGSDDGTRTALLTHAPS
jgi:3-oxoacyl-[acyl-carrier-protein] synthase-1